MLPRLFCLASFAAIAALSADEAPLMISEEDSDELLSVGDFAQKPGANFRFFGDRIELHPKALVGVGYDSNVYGLEDDEIDDTFFRYIAGAEMRFDFATTQWLVASGELESKQYSNETGKNLFGGRGALSYNHEGPITSHRLLGSFARVDEPLIETGEHVEHDDVNGELDWTRRGLYHHQSFVAEAIRVDYTEAATQFDKDQRDNTRYLVTVTSGVDTSEGCEWHLFVQPSSTQYDEEELYWDSVGLTLGIGGKLRFGGRSSVRWELGAEGRKYRDVFQGNSAYDDQRVVIPAGDVKFTLAWEDGSDLHAAAHSRLEDSLHSNAAWNYGLSAGFTYRIMLNARLFGDVGYLELLDSGPSSGQVELRRYQYNEGGFVYAMREGLSLRFLVRYSESLSRTRSDYERFAPSLDLAAIF